MSLQVDRSTGRRVAALTISAYNGFKFLPTIPTGRQVDAMTVLKIVESTQRAHRFNSLQFIPTLNSLNGFNFILSS